MMTSSPVSCSRTCICYDATEGMECRVMAESSQQMLPNPAVCNTCIHDTYHLHDAECYTLNQQTCRDLPYFKSQHTTNTEGRFSQLVTKSNLPLALTLILTLTLALILTLTIGKEFTWKQVYLESS